MHRVVVTGAGTISAFGPSLADADAALRAGRSAIAPLTIPGAETLNQKIAAHASFYALTDYFEPRAAGVLDRTAQFTLIAAREAVGQAGFSPDEALAEQTAVIIGTGIGGQETQEEGYRRHFLEGKRPHPLSVPKIMANAPASQVSMEFGFKGPAFAVASACASATHAIGQAFQMVRTGVARAAVTGGTEALLQSGTMRAWEALRVMSNDACRPFSLGRKGMVLGEGAGVFVLERYEDARARGADILCEIAGHGMSADAGDITAPDPGGMARAIAGALRDGGLDADDVDYINAHGTGTTANDAAESRAILLAFGERGHKLPVSSTKSMHGHALGGAGGIEFACLIASMRGGYAPPTINFVEPDPNCPIDCVPNEARDLKIGVALSNSFAFGGLNAVLAVKAV